MLQQFEGFDSGVGLAQPAAAAPRRTRLRDAPPARRSWRARRSTPAARACRAISVVARNAAAVRAPWLVFSYSGVFHAGHLAEYPDETCPVLALCGQDFAAGLGDPVVAPAPLPGLFDPAAGDPAAGFHAVQRRVQRGQREREHAVGSELDLPADLVAVEAVVFDEREDQELGGAPLGLVKCRPGLRPGGRATRSVICNDVIYHIVDVCVRRVSIARKIRLMPRHIAALTIGCVLIVNSGPGVISSGNYARPQFPATADAGWTQWGGPTRDFHAPSTGLADTWPAGGPPVLWSRPLGTGHSAIVGGRRPAVHDVARGKRPREARSVEAPRKPSSRSMRRRARRSGNTAIRRAQATRTSASARARTPRRSSSVIASSPSAPISSCLRSTSGPARCSGRTTSSRSSSRRSCCCGRT